MLLECKGAAGRVDQGNGNIAPILEFEVSGGGVIEPAPMFPFFPTLP